MLSSFRLNDLVRLTQGRLIGPPLADAPVGNLSTDTRSLVPGDVFMALRGEKFDGNAFVELAMERKPSLIIAEKEITNPTVPILIVPDSLQALIAIARELRSRFKGTVIAVTGSAGKSSTKEMIATLLGPGTVKSPASFNNLLGVSKTLWLVEDHTQFLVLEMGMNHFGEIAELCKEFRPHIGTITNIGDAHIGKLGGQEGVFRAKKELFDYLAKPESKARGVAINVDDPLVLRAFTESGVKLSAISLIGSHYGFSASATDVRVTSSKMNDQSGFLEVEFTLSGAKERVELPIFGKHHAQNLVAAISIASLVGVPREKILERSGSVRPANHRGEILVLSENRLLIDESYNSNPKALASSLESLSYLDPRRRRIVVVGEMRELGEFGPELHRKAGESFVQFQEQKSLPLLGTIIIGVGELASCFLEPIQKSLPAVPCFQVANATEALAKVQSVFKAGDILFVKGSRGIQLDLVVAAYAQKAK